MIYENYFALQRRPFSIAPNPQFLYAHGQYQEALAVLEYGMLHRGGFILLTGEVGTGKTTLCKHLLQSIPSNTEVALILHPQLDRLELLQLICREFAISVGAQAKESELIAAITEFLLAVYAKGGYSLLVIDEAQHLDMEVLELIRLLTNLETHSDKLLQIILLGQPELRLRLQRYELRQLNQRFTARFHLNPLNFRQLRQYIRHRIQVAGSERNLFSLPALLMLKKLTGGIPRLINLLADRSLMGCYAQNRRQVSAWTVYRAAKEVLPQPSVNKWKAGFVPALILIGVFLWAQNYLPMATQIELPKLVSTLLDGEGLNANSSESYLLNCPKAHMCWQGMLPQTLISYSQYEVVVFDQQRWQKWQAPINNEPLVLSRINWQAPFELGSLIKPGKNHAAVSWVRDILSHQTHNTPEQDYSQWQMISPDSAGQESSTFYDVLLVESVKQFQSRHHLLVDGILGKQTLISLALWQQKNKGAI